MKSSAHANIVDRSFVGAKKERWITDTAKLTDRVLDELGIANWEISIVFCDDAFIADLNRTYRDMKGPTDVLAFRQAESMAFPGHGKREYAGDIVISIDTLVRNADTLRVDKRTELLRLIIHAVLHLNGMDHPDGDTAMIDVQEAILAKIGKRKA